MKYHIQLALSLFHFYCFDGRLLPKTALSYH